METLIILVIVAIVIGLVLSPNETVGALKWGAKGARGVVNDAVAIQVQAKRVRVENPQVIKETEELLNSTIFDTTKYHREAMKRKLQAQSELEEQLNSIKL